MPIWIFQQAGESGQTAKALWLSAMIKLAMHRPSTTKNLKANFLKQELRKPVEDSNLPTLDLN